MIGTDALKQAQSSADRLSNLAAQLAAVDMLAAAEIAAGGAIALARLVRELTPLHEEPPTP